MDRVHPDVVAEGIELMSILYDTAVLKAITGEWPSDKDYELKNVPERFKPYVSLHANQHVSSVELCYTAMREKEKQINLGTNHE